MNSKVLIIIIAILVLIVIIYSLLFQNPQPIACTEEAKICPDGSAVGRVPPNCDFDPCPSECSDIKCVWDPCPGKHIPDENGCINCASPCEKSCTCPEGYVQEGDTCNPQCYYSTPKCLAPSIMCNSTTSGGIEELCIASGGVVRMQLCCKSVNDFPNTCLIGGCGCSPTNSKEVKVCDCGENKCWDDVKNECMNL